MLYSEIEGIGKLSKFTLGTVQLGMNYGMANTTGQPSERQAFEILEESASAGVNSLDTACLLYTSTAEKPGVSQSQCLTKVVFPVLSVTAVR